MKYIILVAIFSLCACVSKISSIQSNCTVPTCKMQCMQRFLQCREVCDNSCQSCARRADARAEMTYARYRQEMCVRGGILMHQLNSYRDPLQCLKTTCSCRLDYNLCAAACSGKMYKKLHEAPVCG